MIRKILILPVVLACVSVWADTNSGREAFLRQQAFAEMQRVTGQVDTLQNNFDDLQRRVNQLERGANNSSTKAEIDAIKASIADLRREMANQKSEIIKEVSALIVKMQPKTPPPAPQPKQTVVAGPTSTYTVASGDSLYLIAKAFNTSVAKIRELNNLKNDNLRVGQKLIVPQN